MYADFFDFDFNTGFFNVRQSINVRLLYFISGDDLVAYVYFTLGDDLVASSI